MDKNQSELKLQEFLPYRLYVLANRISTALASHYEQAFQISRPEWRILAVLGETQDLSAAEVAERTAMDKVAVSRAVASLLKAGLLQRQFAQEDKRRSVLRHSKAGSKLYSQIVPVALQYEQDILAQLSQGEIETLNNMLNKLDDLELKL